MVPSAFDPVQTLLELMAEADEASRYWFTACSKAPDHRPLVLVVRLEATCVPSGSQIETLACDPPR